MPNAVAMTSEFNPRRRRATMVMIMFCGFSVGAALGGLLAAALIPQFGWRSVFIVGGLAPLLLVPILVLRLPESVRFLALTGRANDARRAIARIDQPEGCCSRRQRNSSCMNRIWRVFRCCICSGKDGPSVTLLLWVVFFMSLLDIYFLRTGCPPCSTISARRYLRLPRSDRCCRSAAWSERSRSAASSTASRFARWRWCISSRFSRSARSASSDIPLSSSPLRSSPPGFCIVGGQIAANALAAGFYPTSVRATGVGWALGIGRVGSIIGPLVGGALMTAKWSTASVFMAAAAAALCAALAAFSLSRLAGMGGSGKGAADDAVPIEAALRPSTIAVLRLGYRGTSSMTGGRSDERRRRGNQEAQSRDRPERKRCGKPSATSASASGRSRPRSWSASALRPSCWVFDR